MIVDLMPTDDQAMIAESVSAFFADRLPVERFGDPTSRGGAAEKAAWNGLAGLGLFGLGVPAECGGVGYTLAEEVTVAQVAGHHLISPTLIATMVAAHIGDAESYAAGGKRVAFANPLRPFGRSGEPIEVHLIDAADADELLFCTPLGTWLLPASAATPVEGMDETIALARATITPPVSASGNVFQRCELLLAAYLSGGVQRGARNGCRICQGSRAVRPADRRVPGDQTYLRRHGPA